jgi:hypothetical protein
MILPDQHDLLADAVVELAQHHWKVFPLCGKVPAIARAHSRTLYSAIPCAENLVMYPNPLRDCKGGADGWATVSTTPLTTSRA